MRLCVRSLAFTTKRLPFFHWQRSIHSTRTLLAQLLLSDHCSRGFAMAIETGPADIPPLGLQPDFDSSNPMFPFILATVLLSSILTTIFSAARLIIKRLVSTYNVEDCECQTNSLSGSSTHPKNLPDMLLLAWVSISLSGSSRPSCRRRSA